jgi:hypothetical protein
MYLRETIFKKDKKRNFILNDFFLILKEHTKQTSEKSFHINWIYIAFKAQAQKLHIFHISFLSCCCYLIIPVELLLKINY